MRPRSSADARSALTLARPRPELAPFVDALWHLDEGDDRDGTGIPRAPRERALPTGCASLVFRLSDAPIRVFAGDADPVGRSFGFAAVSGARSTFFVRDTSRASRSVGIHFRPGGAAALLGVPAAELAERHTPLEDLGGRDADRARARLLEAATPAGRLELVQRILLERSRASRPSGARACNARLDHPAVAFTVAALESGPTLDADPALDDEPAEPSIRALARTAGLSQRRLLELFRRAIGLPPRLFARVRRFQRAIEAAARSAPAGWTPLALACGFYDQSHLVREFHAFAGLAPSEYARLRADRPNHVPIRSFLLAPDGLPSIPSKRGTRLRG